MASFLGLCNYYRRLIPHFAADAASLYKLTSEPRVLPKPELTDAFAKRNPDFCAIAALELQNHEKPFVLESDAFSIAGGAVLKQFEGDDEVSTLFKSLSLNSAQSNYSR